MVEYNKRLNSLKKITLKTIKSMKDSGEIPYLTTVVKEVSNQITRKDINKFMIRDAIIYLYSNNDLSINLSGKQLIIDLKK